MKHWLAYICIMLFSLQVVPVKEIGELLIKSPVIEKTCCDGDGSDDTKPKKQKESFYDDDYAQAGVATMLLRQRARIAIERASCLPEDYTTDILSPPPDYL